MRWEHQHENTAPEQSQVSRAPYRLVLLPGHVRSEDGLHGQSSRPFLPVAFLLHVHPLVLLDDGCCSSASQELGQAEEEHISITASAFCSHLCYTG